jgi:ABC exporter DevB family membrane fusion protein
MKRSTVLIIAGVLAIGVLSWAARRGHDGASVAAVPSHTPPDFVAGPGLVEALSEEIRVSAQIGGRLDQVLVEEGDRVTAGQVLAVIENRDYRARIASAEAELQLREAERRRLENGARPQERREAAAALAEAEAVLQHARTEQERSRRLLAEGVIARSEVDNAERAARVAQARADAARQGADLINADPREEDVARAESAISLARAHLEEARAQYDKTFVRAPIGGVILRRRCKAGESVSTQFESPIVTMADDRIRRVRVDVDETDVAGVAAGQTAYVTADGFGDRRFPGRVVRVGQLLGRKNVRTDEPTERVDTKVLETLVQLEDGRELPLGLRVQAFIVRRGPGGSR